MKKLFAGAATAAAIFLAPAAMAASFPFESVANGIYAGSLTVNDGSLALTITPEGNPRGSVMISNWGVPLLGLRSVSGLSGSAATLNGWSPLRFTFNQAVNAITFAFGDAGGEDDSQVIISAYSSAGVLIGSVSDTYPPNFDSGKTQTLNVAGASYFIVTSGVGTGFNENSLGWDILDVTVAGVPEASTWALMILGMAAVGGALRRRRVAVRFAA